MAEVNPNYPVYIISKGRWESRLTVRALELLNVPYHIVIEPQEYDQYSKVISPDKILSLPFSNLGQGSIPARNWVWEYSISIGAKRHWILDDNISGFFRLNNNIAIKVASGTIFKASEDFINRYENIAISGFQYFMFIPQKTVLPPYYLNTRVYSCILIKNDIPYRWRGRYNEDTDLSLRALKDGYCTVLFIAFMAYKITSMVMKGRNTDELYKDDGRVKMMNSLIEQHPDVTKTSFKFGHAQHQVDYSIFKKNKLIKKPGIIIPKGVNNYGMILKQGFFSKRDSKNSNLDSTEQVKKIRQPRLFKSPVETLDPCEACGLYKKVQSPKLNWTGDNRLNILIVAESQGENEDREGKQLIGQAGSLWRNKLEPYGLNLDRDFAKVNAVRCRTAKPEGGNRTPSKDEIKYCNKYLWQTIKEINPKMIWLLGNTALESFTLGRGFDNINIGDWRRLLIPDPEANAWVIPLYHPSALLRKHDPNLEAIFDADLKWAVSCIQKERPVFNNYEKCVQIIYDPTEAHNFITQAVILQQSDQISYDYETTRLDPRKEGAEILSLAIGIGEWAWSFPIYKWGPVHQDKFFYAWINVLQDEKVKKIGTNISFEEKWNRKVLHQKSTGWIWDTVLAAHLLEAGRQKHCGLKFQTYLNFGVWGYDREVEAYKTSTDKNGLNRLKELSPEKLCLYNGLDTLFSFKSKQIQEQKMKRFQELFNLYHEALLVFLEMEDQGIPIDEKYYSDQHLILDKQVNTLFKQLMSYPIVKRFEKQFKREPKFELIDNKLKMSDDDVRVLLYDLAEAKKWKFTAKKNLASIDEEVLSKIEHPVAKNIVNTRHLQKIRDTYLAQFERETVHGKINPNFNLHIARSGRPSSDHPNFQNLPKKDKEAWKTVRGGIVPSKGNKIGEADYNAAEVRIYACYTLDPVLIQYIEHPESDMHRDQSVKLFGLPKIKVVKEIRQSGKNSFVFPTFYGSFFEQTGEALWEDVNTFSNAKEIRQHLYDQGWKTLQAFKNHVAEVEDEFWRIFNVSKQWQIDFVKEYQKRKGVIYKTGFVRGGYLSRNQILNTAIQGTAAQCLLWSQIHIQKLIEKEKLKSRMIAQIYDSIIFDLVPEEQEYLFTNVRRISCEDIRDHYKWLIVPLDIEIAVTGIDESWIMKKEIKI